MATIDYEKNAKYFKPTSYKGGIILIGIGLLFLLTGSAGPAVIGLLLAGTGGFLIYNQTAGRPTDAEIDHQVHAVMRDLYGRALAKLGLDADEIKLIPPVIVGGYTLANGDQNQIRKGKDNLFRSTNFEGMVIFFGEQELHAYKYVLSLVVRDQNGECTDVYFYRDVVSVSTNSTSQSVRLVGETTPETWQKEVFILTTSGGTAVECSMSASNGSAGRDIQGARQLIRNKKMQTS